MEPAQISEIRLRKHTAAFVICYEVGRSVWHPGTVVGKFNQPTYTKTVGLGWRFAFACGLYSSNDLYPIDIYFQHQGVAVGSTLRSLEVVAIFNKARRTILQDWPIKSESADIPKVCTYQPDFAIPSNAKEGTKFPVIFSFTVTYAVEDTQEISCTLGHSLSSGLFADTRFFAYSIRRPSGGVRRPLPLFANGALLKAKSAYFVALLSNNGFSESKSATLDDTFPAGEESEILDYDYESDSDLSEAADLADVAESDGSDKTHSEPRLDHVVQSQRKGFGQTIVVKDVAYSTLKALIMYLYTGKILFSPLKSSGAEWSNKAKAGIHCSPKSMYRLADKIGLVHLKQKSREAIRAGLSESNILQEAVSGFTSRYDEIEAMEKAILLKNCRSPGVKAAMPDIMKRAIADGELSSAQGIITVLVERLMIKE
ncbi:hypothetical protein GLOTRDRAFT_127541 [Gloeophyllum trabeum ATCC 11539]|uniref:BTB domain-containing protein n=1 Tax=Gloeophyllum trabeum (strain ATCC 11539 / FP-39264 / Madison 617) TaxID=670483 RepID=S7RVA8_GLOTA|nr:uncharacterized protein GLOTRDRAFT_127541 [Gloeophyllum trabeum ATCC 11539]EPQ57169.1 hypothetical protein GLOTRDRAFT_127541 [Gloeophyllum trabeum ATCC 11539]